MHKTAMLCTVLAINLLMTVCTSEPPAQDAAAGGNSHLGGCILLSPRPDAPEDIYRESGITATEEYKPFTKKLVVNGIVLIGRDDISDDFMHGVGRTVREMFPRTDEFDAALQRQLLENLYKYRAVIPFFKGRDHEMLPSDQEAWQGTKTENSVCDIIMQGVPGQVNEVVEHILHYVTDIGLHYTFPADWGISTTSRLHRVMQEAIAGQFYDIRQYSDIKDDETRERIILQEYAYWLIYTAWDLRETYGPQEAEWHLMNSSQLKSELPQSYQLYEDTVAKIMAPPSPATLEEFVN